MDNNWIKILDRKPAAADLPIMLWNAMDGDAELWSKTDGLPILPDERLTHWCKADIPAPPKEPTLAEKDDSACEKAWLDNSRQMAMTGVDWFTTGWNLALRYERAEILARLRCNSTFDGLVAIRARCEGGRS